MYLCMYVCIYTNKPHQHVEKKNQDKMIESNVGIKIKIYNKWKGKKRSKKDKRIRLPQMPDRQDRHPVGSCMHVCMYVSGSDCVYLVKRGLVEAVINVVCRMIWRDNSTADTPIFFIFIFFF